MSEQNILNPTQSSYGKEDLMRSVPTQVSYFVPFGEVRFIIGFAEKEERDL